MIENQIKKLTAAIESPTTPDHIKQEMREMAEKLKSKLAQSFSSVSTETVENSNENILSNVEHLLKELTKTYAPYKAFLEHGFGSFKIYSTGQLGTIMKAEVSNGKIVVTDILGADIAKSYSDSQEFWQKLLEIGYVDDNIDIASKQKNLYEKIYELAKKYSAAEPMETTASDLHAESQAYQPGDILVYKPEKAERERKNYDGLDHYFTVLHRIKDSNDYWVNSNLGSPAGQSTGSFTISANDVEAYNPTAKEYNDLINRYKSLQQINGPGNKNKEYQKLIDVFETKISGLSENETVAEVTETTEEQSAEAPVQNTDVELGRGLNQYQNTMAIRKLIDEKGSDYEKYSAAELQWLQTYEGAGGLASKGVSEREILDQFFTPDIVTQKMWGMAIKYGFNPDKANNICEPAVGTGRFLEYLPNPNMQKVDAFEIDKYACTICKLTFPKVSVKQASFETMFFAGRTRLGMLAVNKQYDLVIGNPPYREYVSELSVVKSSDGKTERSDTLAHTFDQYFIMRGIDILRPGGLLVYIIPNTFLSNNDKYNDFKAHLSLKCDLVDAYRLPNGIFPNTQVGTDIIVLRKK